MLRASGWILGRTIRLPISLMDEAAGATLKFSDYANLSGSLATFPQREAVGAVRFGSFEIELCQVSQAYHQISITSSEAGKLAL